MKCEKCRAHVRSTDRFCPTCGAPVHIPAVADGPVGVIREDKRVNHRLFAITGLFAVGIVAVIVLIISLINGTKYQLSMNSIYLTKDVNGREYAVVNNKNVVALEGQVDTMQQSLSGDVMAYLDDQKRLCLIRYGKKKEIVVATDAAANFALSSDGVKLLYLRNLETGEGGVTVGELYWYDVPSGKEKRVDDGVLAEKTLCISPRGKSYTYTKNFDQETLSFHTMLGRGGKSGKKWGTSRYVYGLTDNGNCLYWAENDDGVIGNVYVTKKGKPDEKMGAGIEFKRFIFNADCSDALINYNGKCYITRGGAEKESIYSCFMEDFLGEVDEMEMNTGARICNVKDFADNVYWFRDKEEYICVYLNKRLESRQIRRVNHDYAYLTDNGKYIYTLREDTIRCICVSDADDYTDITSGASAFVMSDDGDRIYYVSQNGDLYAIRNKKAIKISENVLAESMVMRGKNIYFLADYKNGVGTLFVSNGGTRKTVENGTDTSALIKTSSGLLFVGEYDLTTQSGTLYRIKSGSKSELLVEDVLHLDDVYA